MCVMLLRDWMQVNVIYVERSFSASSVLLRAQWCVVSERVFQST